MSSNTSEVNARSTPVLQHPNSNAPVLFDSAYRDSIELTGISHESIVQRGTISQPIESLQTEDNRPRLSVDEAHTTRNHCLIGLMLIAIASLTCIIYAVISIKAISKTPSQRPHLFYQDGVRWYRIHAAGKPFISILTNLLISLCMDTMGYIHTTSLRWALKQEQRLFLNSNPRLLTTTQKCVPHSWYLNLLLGICMSICYAANPLLFEMFEDRGLIPSYNSRAPIYYDVGLRLMSLLFLGIGMLGQATISFWCLMNTFKIIRTWSSNPLNATLACLYDDMERIPGRCLQPVHSSHLPAVIINPSMRQASAKGVVPLAERIVRWLWLLVLLASVVATLPAIIEPIVGGPERPDRDTAGYSWYFYGLRFCTYDYRFIKSDYIGNLVELLYLILLQAPLVLALHCTELLVNFNRDEATWRRAISSSGTTIDYNSIEAAATSPPTIALYLLKALAHWAFGNGFDIHNRLFSVRILPLYVLAAVLLLLAVFGTYLMTHQPEGPQPATFGHIQTIANLIDEWSKPMFWGDKGTPSGGAIRHAGTSNTSLQGVYWGAFYGGDCCAKSEPISD